METTLSEETTEGRDYSTQSELWKADCPEHVILNT